MKCQIKGCGKPGVAKNMCDKHYRRVKEYGDPHATKRPSDWGSKSSHPLYDTWRWIRKRTGNGVEKEWEDFWEFCRCVGARPSSDHSIRRVDESRPWGPSNWYWKEKLASSEDAKAYAKAYRKKNPLASKSSDLKKQYGISIEDYLEMAEAQNGVCAICEGEQDGRYRFLSVDHCHETGKIRGLLCNNCNRALGMFKDDPDVLLSAYNYLMEHYSSSAA